MRKLYELYSIKFVPKNIQQNMSSLPVPFAHNLKQQKMLFPGYSVGPFAKKKKLFPELPESPDTDSIIVLMLPHCLLPAVERDARSCVHTVVMVAVVQGDKRLRKLRGRIIILTLRRE